MYSLSSSTLSLTWASSISMATMPVSRWRLRYASSAIEILQLFIHWLTCSFLTQPREAEDPGFGESYNAGKLKNRSAMLGLWVAWLRSSRDLFILSKYIYMAA